MGFFSIDATKPVYSDTAIWLAHCVMIICVMREPGRSPTMLKRFFTRSGKNKNGKVHYGFVFFENMVKVAGIRAIADNHLEPVVNLNHAQWARDLVKWCVETMVHDVRRHVADGYYQHLAVHNVLALAVFR